jgi:hypothetical protein
MAEPKQIQAGRVEILEFALPPPVCVIWQDLATRKLADLPFRFVVAAPVPPLQNGEDLAARHEANIPQAARQSPTSVDVSPVNSDKDV